jgi:hypothetical protein
LKRKISYWVVLGLFLLMMTGSALGYLTGSQQMIEPFRHLGYPGYFRIMLGVAKLLGVPALIAPRVPPTVREWAYAGFGITMIAAVISHISDVRSCAARGRLGCSGRSRWSDKAFAYEGFSKPSDRMHRQQSVRK